MNPRPRDNVVVPTAYGMMIVNRNDWTEKDGQRFGVGLELLETGTYAQRELDALAALVRCCGPDPVLLDIGANIGVHSLLFSGLAGTRGRVHAFEAQRILFQMLAGNLALNSIENVYARQVALGAAAGMLRLQPVDYAQPWNFGGMGLIEESPDPQFARGTPERAAADRQELIEVATIDSFALPQVDFMKIDVEGMELDVLRGGVATIERDRPPMQLEWLERDQGALPAYLLDTLGYRVYKAGLNLICFPAERQSPHISGAQELSLDLLRAAGFELP